jgi:hypothetical protein
MKPDAFLVQAGRLAAQARTDPANARTAASRAYYGAYHLVRLFLMEMNFPVGKDHDLHKPLLATRHAIGIDAARYLSRLYDFRRRADYELLNTDSERQESAQLAVENAERLAFLLLQMKAEPLRAEIVAGLEAYKQQLKPRLG